MVTASAKKKKKKKKPVGSPNTPGPGAAGDSVMIL
jgi:hypothetical protein